MLHYYKAEEQPLARAKVTHEIGARVSHTGHGEGKVLGYNHSEGLYNGVRYPYIILFNSGFVEVYSESDLVKARE